MSSSHPNSKGVNCSGRERRQRSPSVGQLGTGTERTSYHCHHESCVIRCSLSLWFSGKGDSLSLQASEESKSRKGISLVKSAELVGLRDALHGRSCRMAVKIGSGSSPLLILGATLLNRNHSRCNDGSRSFQIVCASSLVADGVEGVERVNIGSKEGTSKGAAAHSRSQRKAVTNDP